MMEDKNKSKEELAEELHELRHVLGNMERERQELEKTLGESLTRYRAIVEDQSELICRFDPDTTLTFVNEAYCRFLNKRREDLLGSSFMPLIPPEHRKNVKAHFDSLGPENPVATHEHQVIGKNGEIRWQQWTNRAIWDKQGVIKEFQSVGRDITNRKLAEEALCRARDEMEQKVKERTSELLKANEQLKREIKNREREKSRRRESEAYIEAILNAAPVGIGLVKNRVFGWVSHRMGQMLGYSADELVGQSAIILYESEEEFDRVGRVKYPQIKERGIGAVETRFKRKDGNIIDVLLCSSALDPADPSKEAIFTALDITERKRAQKTLQESEERFAVFMDNLPAGVLMKDEDSRVLYVNKYLRDHFGAEVWIGRNSSKNLPKERAQSVRADDLRALKEGPITVLEKHTDSQDVERIYQTVKFPIRLLDGSTMLGGIALDMTEQKLAEKASQESEEKYRSLVESSIDGIAIVQGNEMKFANQALLDMYGASRPEQVLGHNFTRFVAHEYRDLLLQRGLDRERGKDVPSRYEFKALRQDQSEFVAEISVNPISYQGKPARQAVLRDVTARKRGERTLRESEQKYRLLVENLPSIVYKGYQDWSVDFVDEKIEALTGYSMKEFNSRRMKWSDLIEEEDIVGARESFIQALKTDKSYVREYRIRTKGESILWIQERAMIVCDHKGEIDYVSGVFFDITEQKRAQEALSKSQAELSEKSRHLEEVNAALNVLLKRREEDRHELEENVLTNVKELVFPYIERLRNSRLHSEQMTLVSILESNINEIFSPFVTKLSSKFLSLTPTEIKVASLIKDGKSSKEIASLLNASENTIRSHRFHIRSKLSLKNKKVNLRSYLRSLPE
jgi:PAS domain S-box-containing protein